MVNMWQKSRHKLASLSKTATQKFKIDENVAKVIDAILNEGFPIYWIMND